MPSPITGGSSLSFDGDQDCGLVLSNSLHRSFHVEFAVPPFSSEHFRCCGMTVTAMALHVAPADLGLIGRSDVIRLLDHLGIAAVSFCGLSVGGWSPVDGLNAAKRWENCVVQYSGHIGNRRRMERRHRLRK